MNNVKSFPPEWNEYDANNCGIQPDWNQSDEMQPDYIKNKIGYREIFTKQTGVCTIENIEANTLYLVQDLSIEDEDTLANIRNNMKYSNAGNRFCTIVPQLDFWTYMPYFGYEAALSANFNKNNFTQYDTSDEYNYYLSNKYNRFYIILDRTKLSSQNAETFPKDGIYFKTTNANTNRVSTAIYDYYRIDTLYLSSSVATIGELNENQDTLIQSGASIGQVAKITAVDSNGKPTAWQAVDMPSGGGETWEKIAEIVIPEGADESTALTISQDFDGNPFSLVKARLCAKFPKYTGETSIPKFSFAMLNGKTSGSVSPLAYTSVWPEVSKSNTTGTVYEIDVSGIQQIEHVIKSLNSGWSPDTPNNYIIYGTSNSKEFTIIADTLWAKPITSIGGAGMLIYPGCRFVLYGVRT